VVWGLNAPKAFDQPEPMNAVFVGYKVVKNDVEGVDRSGAGEQREERNGTGTRNHQTCWLLALSHYSVTQIHVVFIFRIYIHDHVHK
jgi:hypothetical protein